MDKILQYIKAHPESNSRTIWEQSASEQSYATLKRQLKKLVSQGLVNLKGKGPSSNYSLSESYILIEPIDLEAYFENEVDERIIKDSFQNAMVKDVLSTSRIFTSDEEVKLMKLQEIFLKNTQSMSKLVYSKEMERLAIDLSWKSSQIEGNTYSLLETEKLLRDKETAQGKSKDEATMLINHKEALDFIISEPHYFDHLSISKIETIHGILVKELKINRNLRRSRVGISGTNYKPLENEFQIREALELACHVINQKEGVFEKALLSLLLISYIQPFEDGNKRTARIVSNAMLIHYNHCPLSFRTVDSIEYKKAMLLFYEQNNLYNFKKLFVEQFEFAVQTYF